MSRNRSDRNWVFMVLADVTALVTAYIVTYALRFHSRAGVALFDGLNTLLGLQTKGDLGPVLEMYYAASAPRIVLLLLAILLPIYAVHDLYAGRRFLRPRPMAWNVMVANGIALAVLFAYFYLSRNIFHPRSMFATLLTVNTVLCVGFRVWMEGLRGWLRQRGWIDACRTVLIGGGREADAIATLCETLHPHGIAIVHRLHADAERPMTEVIARLDALRAETAVDMVIGAEPSRTVADIMLLLEATGAWNMAAKVLSDRLDVIVDQARLPADRFNGIPLLHFESPGRRERIGLPRRAATRAAAALLLLLLAPLLALLAAVIRATTPGPAFFIQERIGVNRRPFRMIKFRTMRDRADESRAQLEAFNESGQGLFKMRADPRVTRIGRLLRRFSIDELPQIVNVLRGEMAFVGPRPLPRSDCENYFEEWHYSRHDGLPGLTGLWQISGRSDLDFHGMCILDIYYLRNRDWILDVRILLRTAWVVVFAKGAY